MVKPPVESSNQDGEEGITGTFRAVIWCKSSKLGALSPCFTHHQFLLVLCVCSCRSYASLEPERRQPQLRLEGP